MGYLANNSHVQTYARNGRYSYCIQRLVPTFKNVTLLS